MQRLAVCLACLCSVACGQVVPIANPSFEEGADGPAGWTLSGGQGARAADGFDGRHALAVTGDGQDSNFWRSGGLALQPGQVYCLRFRARALPGAAGGTAVSGPAFANHDIGVPGETWTAYRSVFATPARLDAADAWLRFGQWQVRGTLQFDQAQLTAAQPVYARGGELLLGDGEELAGNQYTFALNAGDSRNHARVLDHHQCNWNSNRWVFGSDSEVVYRFAVAGRRQTRAAAEVAVNWYQSGQLVVEASRDGQAWTELGRGEKVGALKLELPAALLPAEALWLRLTGKAKERVGQNSDPGSLQVNELTWSATVDGPPAALRGATRFVEVRQAAPRLRVAVQSLGDGLPGGINEVLAQVENPGAALRLRAAAVVHRLGEPAPAAPGQEVTIAPGTSDLRLPYTVGATGEQTLELSLVSGREALFAADVGLQVAELYNAAFGETLPASGPRAGLWWCESGWKVSRTRPPPARAGAAVQLRAARNEVDCAQVVVRPSAGLQGFTAAAGALSGPNGASLPAAAVELLRVRYCPVARPTDATSTAGDWPDPLPPLRAPLDLPAGQNQPLWVRVTVPRDAAPGDYTGSLRLAAAGWQADVPLRVHVYGFTLPDRMTCQTAFGFDPGLVFRYQKLTTDAERRAVLDKYWADYSAHHIAPYNPAPLDPFRVTWPGAGGWTGGARDGADRHAGVSSLRVADESTTGHARAAYGVPLPIGDKGLRLRFWHKTAAPGQDFIVTFNHYDAGGQWMSGRNNDMAVQGNGQWQAFDRSITAFPPGAAQVRLTLWPCPWTDAGDKTGTVWFDEVSVTDLASGKELIAGGDFEPLDPAALKPTIDWTAWDREMTRAVDQYQFNTFGVPIEGMGGGTFFSRTEPSLLGYAEATPEYQAAFRAYCHAVEEHLRAKGWLDEGFVYWFDEPEPRDYEFVMNGFRKLREAAPDIRRMLTEEVQPELGGGPNLWCPVSPNYNHERAEARRKLGEQFWWYVCTGPKAPYCTLFIDHPATELRVWLWQTWQRRIDGILVWQSNYWTSPSAYPDPARPQDPYADPMGWVSGYDTAAGTRAAWGNGDGRFIYPPEAAADGNPAAPLLDGPVDSIRWEMLRDGIEDYEYLVMLRELLRTRGGRLAPERQKACEALLEVPAEITADMTTYTRDPAPLEARRDAVARAIEELSRL